MVIKATSASRSLLSRDPQPANQGTLWVEWSSDFVFPNPFQLILVFPLPCGRPGKSLVFSTHSQGTHSPPLVSRMSSPCRAEAHGFFQIQSSSSSSHAHVGNKLHLLGWGCSCFFFISLPSRPLLMILTHAHTHTTEPWARGCHFEQGCFKLKDRCLNGLFCL